MKPMVTEKAVMMIEAQNVLSFKTEKNMTKEEIKKEVEEIFEVKVSSVRTRIKGNNKYAYVKLKPEFLAIDIATKLGII
ncbi:MAG: 50S ribosomal protein L23 [Nanoarchaeota archaeon]|nr:50S ribosomal protein L23 [Nanoarchaeota archaeon]